MGGYVMDNRYDSEQKRKIIALYQSGQSVAKLSNSGAERMRYNISLLQKLEAIMRLPKTSGVHAACETLCVLASRKKRKAS